MSGTGRVRHVNAAVRRKLKRYSPPLRRKKTFAHCWPLENIFVDQDFSNKEQAIQFLCGNLGVNGRTEHPFELEEDVWQREEIVTTGVGFGVAIPHTKSQ
ncbi:multiphosphoryl transfer protein 1 [includes phosphoenolpyruvate-protein phosphotransferase;phosphocarrier protein Hp; fructose-like phosphotransferase enzyme IIA component] [Escherichia coli]|uniref:Multiphosphoryl transfer protein 1 [includes phosphoenolpyruvate-protein phosphotransferasephosphocarrier protein Hp fructose-like phosphotransferase enzyme IIA component] n=1 Tax=Escherichia coli TaxID=562 RepID=A0A377CB50_ECOLX|nr:multiphosphoryl transfer protein 1 [includes phosphoenolpyruvate-protein phosphotransferase;phosphocarrier protein Hp; fructose-like phosphotransferase enzyme IIA component] [Escherichia coli]